jgi:Trk-type K+ transport system membrane component
VVAEAPAVEADLALMYLGRLEIIRVLVLFTASHWRA